MRSKGFLFSFLGVWGWWTGCGPFSCFNSPIASSPCLWGKWKKVMFCDVWKCISRFRRGTLWHSGKSCFAGLQLRRRAVYGESEKRWCFVTCESAFRVAGVGLCGTQAKVAKVASQVSNVYVAALSMGKVRKDNVLWRVKLHCEVWSEECEEWCGKCEVRSVKCERESGECEVWRVECEVSVEWSV